MDLRVRRFFFDTAKSQAFEYFFLAVILVNVTALSMSFSYQPTWYANMLTVVNSICTWLFVMEILILWMGSGVRDYFRTRFNQFDLIIVMLTAYEFFYEQNLVSFHIGFNPSIFRVIRMIRIFKLFQKFPRLVQLGQTVWFSLPALYNVTLLMVLRILHLLSPRHGPLRQSQAWLLHDQPWQLRRLPISHGHPVQRNDRGELEWHHERLHGTATLL